MNEFKDLGIAQPPKPMSGEKIKMDKVLNKRIIVHDYKIGESKYKDKGNGKMLTIQIDVDNTIRVIFTGSVALQETIQKIPKDKYPFSTTIVKEDEQYKFT